MTPSRTGGFIRLVTASGMTTPDERTRAVVDTRQFLETLAEGDDITLIDLVRTVAVILLRHYPEDIDLDASAAALPAIWAPPTKRRL